MRTLGGYFKLLLLLLLLLFCRAVRFSDAVNRTAPVPCLCYIIITYDFDKIDGQPFLCI